MKERFDGEPVTLSPDKKNIWREYFECCDCGLTHLLIYRKLSNGNLETVVVKDVDYTKEARKKNKYKGKK